MGSEFCRAARVAMPMYIACKPSHGRIALTYAKGQRVIGIGHFGLTVTVQDDANPIGRVQELLLGLYILRSW